MVEFVDGYDMWKDQLPNLNEITLRMEMKSSSFKFSANPRTWPSASKEITFILSNIEWRLYVKIENGCIRMMLFCQSTTPENWSSTIYSKITISTESSHFLPQRNINSKSKSTCLVEKRNINADNLKSEKFNILLWINVDSNIKCILDNYTFLKWYEQLEKFTKLKFQRESDIHQQHFEELKKLKVKNEELLLRLSYYEDKDKESVEMFKHVLRLFETKCCRKFEHEMLLANKVKVHFLVTSLDTTEAKTVLEQERDELKAQVAKLRQQLKTV